MQNMLQNLHGIPLDLCPFLGAVAPSLYSLLSGSIDVRLV